MSDGTQVGRAFIEVTPKIRMQKAQAEIKKQLSEMARMIDREFNRHQRELTGGLNKKMRAFQQGQTKDLFAEQRAEMESWQKLQKQKTDALKGHETQRQKAFEAEKKRIAESMRAQKSLAEQKNAALAAQQKRIEMIQKAEIQAHAENIKRNRQAAIDATKQDAYLRARTLGRMSPELAGKYATGGLGAINPNATAKQLRAMAAAATGAGMTTARAFDNAAHHLSQLSTRIGLASFQLQLLGGFATTFLTGPVAYGFAALTKSGMGFAVATDQATASLRAMLPAGYDVAGLVGRLQKMAIASPAFNADDVIRYTAKLTSAGLQIGKTEKLMGALSNIFATFTVTGASAELALRGIAQVQQKGRVYAEELNQQIAEQIPIHQLLADALGVTQEELQALIKEGMSADTFIDALIKIGSSADFVDGAARSVSTLGGAWQQFLEKHRTTLGNAFLANKDAILKALADIEPVVEDFINWFVKKIPVALRVLGGIIQKIRELKAQFDALSPAQKQTAEQLLWITLAAGPAAIAIGIFGTALSGLANAASLSVKALSLMGSAVTAASGWIMLAVVAIGVAVTALGILYTRSESVRLAVLRVFNLIKEYIARVFLPVLDRFIGAWQSLEHTFSFVGLKSEHLAYVLGILAAPIGMLIVLMSAVIVVIKGVQLAMIVLAAVAYGLLQTVALLILGFQKLFEVFAFISFGDSKKRFEGMAKTLSDWREAVGGLADKIDIGQQWQGFTQMDSNATDGLQDKLNAMDLTTSGLSGVFGTWNGILDQTIDKQVSLKDAVNNARQAMQTQATTAMSAQNASDNWNKSLIALKDSIKQNKQTLDEKTQAGQQNRDMLKAATQASYEMMLQDIASGVPMDLAIRRHRDRTNALKDEFGKNKETRDEAQKLIETYGKVPKDVKTLLELMGFTDVAGKITEILAAQKVAANPGMSYQKALQAERKAWQFEKGEGLKNGGVGKKHGGIIRGPGGPTGDKIPIMASDQEYMIRAAAARNLGKPVLDFINRHGTLPLGGMYAKGGQVTWPMRFDMSETKFPEILGGSAGGGGMGWVKMMAVLRQRFPGLPLISGYRPGAITSTGNRSYHALGRAVDLPPSWDVFNWISQNYGKGTKELIFTPAGGRQIKNGNFHTFSGGTIAEDHYNHVHWAYDNGGTIAPNTPFINKTGANELALNAAQGKALEQKIRNSDRPISVTVYVDGVKRDAEIVFDEKAEELIKALGGV